MKCFTILVRGKFYIGDLCYALADDVYENVWGEHGYEDGAYADSNGYEFAVVGTAYGDGCYSSSKVEYVFPVDAGNIGIADIVLCKDVDKLGEWGAVIDWSGSVDICYDAGDIIIRWGDEELVVFTGDDTDGE